MCGLSAIAGLLVIITVYVVGFADSTEKNYPVHYRFSLHSIRNAHLLLRRIFTFLVSIIETHHNSNRGLEKLEIQGNLTAVREIWRNLPKFRVVSRN